MPTVVEDNGRARRLLLGVERPVWQAQASCRSLGPDLFYAEGQGATQYTDAKKVCAECPVVMECADYGSHFGEKEGLWGGMSPVELRKWRRARGGKAVCLQCERVFRHPVTPGTTISYCSAECRRRAATRLQTASRKRRKVSA